jgi:hypothetical protein
MGAGGWGQYLECNKDGQRALAATHAPTMGQRVRPTIAFGQRSSAHSGTWRPMSSAQALWLALANTPWPSVGRSRGSSLPRTVTLGASHWGQEGENTSQAATMAAKAPWRNEGRVGGAAWPIGRASGAPWRAGSREKFPERNASLHELAL